MESQLNEYRARKAQECKELNSRPGIWTQLWKRNVAKNDEKAAALTDNMAAELSDNTHILEQKQTVDNNPRQRSRFLHTLVPHSYLHATIVLLKVILWVLLLAIFIHIEFAAVYMIASIFYVIYSTLDTHRQRAPGEPSAYSVFNPNCEQIDGTLTAAQFERELTFAMKPTDK